MKYLNMTTTNTKCVLMKTSLTSVAWVFLLAAGLFGQEGGKTYINGYYTCLPYDCAASRRSA